MSEQRFSPADQCIYCGAKCGELTDEHIVPFSLGGTIVLPKASCKSCQTSINSFEASLATETYISFRSAQRFPSRTKSLLEEVPVEFSVGPLKIVRKIPIDEAPVIVIVPLFGLPPFIPGTQSLPAKLTIMQPDARRFQRAFKYCREAYSVTAYSGGIRAEGFARLIMKISYGFAWLVDPQSAFSWHGRSRIISGKFPEYPYFNDLFSVPNQDALDQDDIFRVTVFTEISTGKEVLFCQIEILSSAKVPTYICQIGPSNLKHPFGLEFTSSSDVRELASMQLRLPPASHLVTSTPRFNSAVVPFLRTQRRRR